MPPAPDDDDDELDPPPPAPPAPDDELDADDELELLPELDDELIEPPAPDELLELELVSPPDVVRVSPTASLSAQPTDVAEASRPKTNDTPKPRRSLSRMRGILPAPPGH